MLGILHGLRWSRGVHATGQCGATSTGNELLPAKSDVGFLPYQILSQAVLHPNEIEHCPEKCLSSSDVKEVGKLSHLRKSTARAEP